MIHNLKKQFWNPKMFLEFYQLEIIKQIFMNRFLSDNEDKLAARLNIEWAIKIRNKINYLIVNLTHKINTNSWNTTWEALTVPKIK